MIDDFNGKWIGYFTYGEGYPESFCDKKVGFTLELKINNGEFTGTCYDDQVSSLMEGIITVTGFIENNIISFIKQYPSFYIVDENYEVLIDKNKRHPGIHYFGTYDQDTRTFSGKREIETEHPQYPFQYSLISSGDWEIKGI